MKRASLALIVAFAYAAVSLLQAGPARAHGTFDQSLEGDPGCNTGNFGSSVTAASGQRQSFVPTGSLLASVALCVSAAAPNTPLIVAVYTQGGALVGGGSTASNPSIPDAAGPPVRFVHVDFLQPYAVTPGSTYVIENVSGVAISWHGTASGSPYSYCHGAPNTSAVGDYGFQSFLADSPGASAACPEPASTNTPFPPMNTAVTATNTPAPGGTTPTNTPAIGVTAAASPTLPSGSVADGNSEPAPSTGAPGGPTNSGGAGGAGSQPSGLPGSGFGYQPRSDFLSIGWLVAASGALLVAIGLGLRFSPIPRRGRR